MKIGVPKEIKNNENRVSLTPGGAQALTQIADAVYSVDNILHYCVANIPGAMPFTSTMALTNATLPYAIKLADMGWEKACEANDDLQKGLNIVNGKVVCQAVADTFGIK